MSVSESEGKEWTLFLKDVKPSDQGWYMCQINTDPMMSIMGFLEINGNTYFNNIIVTKFGPKIAIFRPKY